MDTAQGRTRRYWALLTKYAAPQSARVAALSAVVVGAAGADGMQLRLPSWGRAVDPCCPLQCEAGAGLIPAIQPGNAHARECLFF